MAVLLPVLFAAEAFSQQQPVVRVLISDKDASVRVKIEGFYEMYGGAGGKLIRKGKNLRTTVARGKNGIVAAKEALGLQRLFIASNDPDAIIVNERHLRGNIELINKPEGLLIINHIGLEDYVRGVLIYEASHYWPKEALKAMAVVVRSYALYQSRHNSSREYDLKSTIFSQVYGGKLGERYRLDEVVEDTQGLLLVYNNEVLEAFHHATCAGHTEDAAVLWGIDLPPLKGVPCAFCKDSPHYKWHYVISREELKKKLRAAGYKAGDISDIAVMERNRSGRVVSLRLLEKDGNTDVSGKDLRSIVGANLIRSTNFSARIEEDDVIFEGFGWGHGVGLCQWGAYFMAKQGYTFRQILEYYYPQSQVSKIP